jgi:hypothetical protein
MVKEIPIIKILTSVTLQNRKTIVSEKRVQIKPPFNNGIPTQKGDPGPKTITIKPSLMAINASLMRHKQKLGAFSVGIQTTVQLDVGT